MAATQQSRLRIGLMALYHSRLGVTGGLDVYTRQLVDALADFDPNNHYVVLVADYGIDAWSYRTWPSNISFEIIYKIEPGRGIVTRAYRALRRRLGLPVEITQGDPYMARQIEALDLDVVHYPATLIYPLSLRANCVLTFFDLQHEYYPEFFTDAELKWRARNYRPSVEKATTIISPSEFTRQTLISKYAVPESKLRYIPVGLDEAFEKASRVDIESVRAKYNLPTQYIYYPANTWPHKNHARLMAALRHYRDCFGEPPCLVVSGRLPNDVRDPMQLAIAADVASVVMSLGFIPEEDVRALYAGALMLIFPSLFEGFGIPLLEAMASDCPIVAANAAAIPDCVGDAALLFDPVDPRSIANAIHTAVVNEKLRLQLVEHGRRQLHRFYWRKLVPQIVDVYQLSSRQAHGR